MTAADIRTLVKLNLSLTSAAYDTYLDSLIETAKAAIQREGIALDDTPESVNLIVMYAAYLFRKRAEDNPIMPRMLRYALNQMLFAQKAGAT